MVKDAPGRSRKSLIEGLTKRKPGRRSGGKPRTKEATMIQGDTEKEKAIDVTMSGGKKKKETGARTGKR